MVQYPSVWEQVESQTQNLQLYNVDPVSSEVAALVAEVEAHSNCKVLKVGYGNLDSMSCNPACDMAGMMFRRVRLLSACNKIGWVGVSGRCSCMSQP